MPKQHQRTVQIVQTHSRYNASSNSKRSSSQYPYLSRSQRPISNQILDHSPVRSVLYRPSAPPPLSVDTYNPRTRGTRSTSATPHRQPQAKDLGPIYPNTTVAFTVPSATTSSIVRGCLHSTWSWTCSCVRWIICSVLWGLNDRRNTS